MNSKEEIIVFIKNPELGKVKTRLAITIGNDKALKVYLKLIDSTLSELQGTGILSHLFFSEKVDHTFIGQKYSIQEGVDLGLRMKNAFAKCFRNHCQKVVIIGTDCPGLSTDILKQAFQALDTNDVVIGPAMDGGYYLLGMKKLHSNIFDHMEWSTATVYDETVKRLNKQKLSFTTLVQLRDIDNEEDLVALSKDFGYLHLDS